MLSPKRLCEASMHGRGDPNFHTLWKHARVNVTEMRDGAMLINNFAVPVNMCATDALHTTVWARPITISNVSFVLLIPKGSSSHISECASFVLSKRMEDCANDRRINFGDITMISPIGIEMTSPSS